MKELPSPLSTGNSSQLLPKLPAAAESSTLREQAEVHVHVGRLVGYLKMGNQRVRTYAAEAIFRAAIMKQPVADILGR